MIDSIRLQNVATYGSEPEILGPLSMFNYIFGANASGKTTISRIIADEASYPTCSVKWKGLIRLQPLVYNLDFIDRNFNQSDELKGVFTLGQQNIETLKKIGEARAEADSHKSKIETLTMSLQGADGAGGKVGELADLEEEFKTKCWAQKQKHDEAFFGAFEGYRNNAEKFKAKLLLEKGTNTSGIATLDDLRERAKTLFGSAPTLRKSIATVDFDALLECESRTILSKKIIGREDVDIAAMIQKLGNSDWVKEGLSYYRVNGMVCPFCQQITSEAFSKSLTDYFDETFTIDTQSLKDLDHDYRSASARSIRGVSDIVEAAPDDLDIEKMKAEQRLLESAFRTNIEKIAQKIKEPSKVVQFETISQIKKRALSLIETANTIIDRHNRMVNELPKERARFTKEVWRYLIDAELKQEIVDYEKRKSAIDKGISSLETQLRTGQEARRLNLEEIRQLEKQTTSVQPTIDEINSLLTSFGFCGFSLAKAANGISYKLLREDGEDAKQTLSEGERSFVTFLYFYHLIKGSHTESGVTSERIVVFDDPVSSLDCDVLFVVGSLIKQLIQEVRDGTCLVKQVFVMTHNIYFHREVTFNSRRCNDQAMAEETFWIARKRGTISTLQRFDNNPIKTSYELLWQEVRNPQRDNTSIQNTLRRILESYFRLLGGIDPDKICFMFEGNERLMCKSLFSWVNAGSHAVYDDLYISADDSTAEAYLRVFRQVFEKQDQLAHYNMMMGL